MPGLMGRKVGMTRLIADDGHVVPVTVVECHPNVVTHIKTIEKDGYLAVVQGFSELKKPTKNRKYRYSREFSPEESKEYKKGDTVTCEIFEENERIKITGVAKGKGFQGVVKRHNFSRGPETHGSHHHRAPGSIGACAKPGRVAKGKKLPGRMGGGKQTKTSTIAYLDPSKNLVGIKGPVPGAPNTLIIIQKTS